MIDVLFKGGALILGAAAALLLLIAGIQLMIGSRRAKKAPRAGKPVSNTRMRVGAGLLFLAVLTPLVWLGNEIRIERIEIAGFVAAQKRIEAEELLRLEQVKAQVLAAQAISKIQWLPTTPASVAARPETEGPKLTVTSSPEGADVWSGTAKLGTTPVTLHGRNDGMFLLELRSPGKVAALLTGQLKAQESAQLHALLAADPMADAHYTVPDVGLELVRIEPGVFQMGSANGDNDERPVTPVQITQRFMIGKFEVTQDEWWNVVGSRPSSSYGRRRPVEQVSWEDAMFFCRELPVVPRHIVRT